MPDRGARAAKPQALELRCVPDEANQTAARAPHSHMTAVTRQPPGVFAIFRGGQRSRLEAMQRGRRRQARDRLRAGQSR
jgi:hypothetical protein